MIRRTLVASLALVAGLVALTSAAAASDPERACGTITWHQAGFTFHDRIYIRSGHTSCVVARNVLYDAYARPPAYGGWRCAYTERQTAYVVCRRPGAVIYGRGVSSGSSDAVAQRTSAAPILAPPRVCIPGAGCDYVPNTIGFGRVKPSKIFFGGDGTGLVCRIHWIAWGGRFAIGTGTAADVTGHQDDAHARWSPAVIIAFDLGSYRGRPAYGRVRWSFPDGEVRPESRSCSA